MECLTNNLTLLAGGTTGGLVLWLLKRIPNDKIYDFIEGTFYKFGVVATLGMTKWKLTKKLWNSTIEPYCVDLLDNTIGAAVKGFIEGLRSDN